MNGIGFNERQCSFRRRFPIGVYSDTLLDALCLCVDSCSELAVFYVSSGSARVDILYLCPFYAYRGRAWVGRRR